MTKEEFEYQHSLLGNRSSKILGGYVTEQMLLETFMTPELVYTKSWWFSRANRETYWFVEKSQLSELDLRICAMLESKGNNCYQLYLDQGQWVVKKLSSGECWTVPGFVEAHSLKKLCKTKKETTVSEHEQKLLTKCITYYGATGLLPDIQRSIQIEDSFLNQYFYTSNVDLFVAQRVNGTLEPACLEIKFKDAFSYQGKAVLGVEHNQLQNIFTELENCGMKVYVVVLYDTCRDRDHVESTNIFRYLEAEAERQWLWIRVSGKATYWEYTMQSQKTAFTGVPKKPRPVYCIPTENFDPLTDLAAMISSDKLLNSDGTQVDVPQNKGPQVKRCPRCGAQLRVRKGQYGPFLGCSSYPKCKYTEKI